MSKYKQLLESIFFESDFINQLKTEYGITDKMADGGLVLPNGQLIQVFKDGIGSHYDKVGSNDSTDIDNNSDFSYRADDFDEKILENNIVRYSLNHTIQPDYIKLPSLNLTDEQKSTVQELIRHCSDKGISVMLDGPLGFVSIKANQDDVLPEILHSIKQFYDDEYNALIAESEDYESKKVFDKDSGYNISKDEEFIYEKLKEKYPNIQKSVTDDRFVNPETHRHFQIDFYDPDSDTAFNLNKHIKHGRRKYDPDDPNCQEDIRWLENQPGEFYAKILHTWKDLDPLKRRVAAENGLKFIEWFNLDEFNKWYDNPLLSYEEYRYAPDSMQYDSEEYFNQKARGRDVYGNDSDYLG